MIFDNEDIDRMRKAGIKVVGADGKPIIIKTPGKSDMQHLMDISRLLEDILSKSDARFEKMEMPKVTVNTAPVTVNTPEPAAKWRFVISRDAEGRMKEIVATAVG